MLLGRRLPDYTLIKASSLFWTSLSPRTVISLTEVTSVVAMLNYTYPHIPFPLVNYQLQLASDF